MQSFSDRFTGSTSTQCRRTARVFRPPRRFFRVLSFLLRRRRPPYAGFTFGTGGSSFLAAKGFSELKKLPTLPITVGVSGCVCVCICTLSSFILSGALVAVLVRSARRFLREPHLCAPRLFAVGPTETTRELIHAYSKTDTLFAVQTIVYKNAEDTRRT